MTARDSAGPGRDGLVRSWLRVVAATVYVPRSSHEIEKHLSGLLDTLVSAAAEEPFDAAPGAEVGAQMVEYGLTGVDTLRRSVDLLAAGLFDTGAPPARVVPLMAALSAGYADALRKRTLQQQDDMKLALLNAKHRADRDRRASETRFREVFTSSAIGIAITELDGRFVDTNPALAGILACTPADLAGRSLGEFLTDEDAERRSGLAPLGGRDRSPDRRLLVRSNGETAWVYLTTSVLRDEAGEPHYLVAMVQDLSELELLQGRLSHQLLHDALTGVANRLHFESRLERVHGQAAPTTTLTLCCLDLDALGMVNTTHGHAVGDWLLRTAADRLKALFAEEAALVARIGGDEFAVLVENAPDTAVLVERIQAELAEPGYHGHDGLAVGATVGVARAKAAEMSAAELFRAAESALRRARAGGRRQWAEHDERVDRRSRALGRVATALPGAWENGELDVAYQPVVRLSDHRWARVRAVPHLAGHCRTPGDPTATELAEATGLSAALGPWLLTSSTARVPMWSSLLAPDAPAHRVLLSALQSTDENLSATVNRAVVAAGVSPALLEIGLDAAAALDRADAQDNLRTLGDIGVVTALHGFVGGPRQLALVERFHVRTVILSDPFEGWRPDWLPNHSVPVRATRELVAALVDLGAEVGVLGVRDAAEARWWAGVGVATGEGPAFGGPRGVDEAVEGIREGGRAAG